MSAESLDEAYCLTCGYRLRGLPGPVCPECGQPFDPNDPATFERDPRRRRRRRWLLRGGVALAIALLALLLCPRQLLDSRMTFACSRCGRTLTVKRWEPVSPRWIPFRYPGIAWTSEPAPASGTGLKPMPQAGTKDCTEHAYRVQVTAEFPVGSCTGQASAQPGEAVFVNGREATPSTAAAILKSMMSRSNFGIAIWSAPRAEADN